MSDQPRKSPTTDRLGVREMLLGEPPPPIRAHRGRRIMLIAAGVIVAGLLLVVVFSIERPPARSATTQPEVNPTELISPAGLAPGELANAGTDIRDEMNIAFPQGGSIQITDDHGKLSQQYRYERSEVLPAGLMRMQRPVVELYVSGDRVLHMIGQTALVKAPHRALESGTLTGDVVIRMYDLPESGPIDFAASTPTLLIRTGEAKFDNQLGEVRADGLVDIQTATAHLPGTGLRLLINDKLNRPERLAIDQVQFIKLASLPEESAEPVATRPVRTTSRPARAGASTRPTRPKRDGAQQQTTVQFYRLNIHQNVRIAQGDDATGWHAVGDDLNVVFSMDSSGIKADRSATPNVTITMSYPWPLTGALLAVAAADTQPAGASADLYSADPDQEVTITCSGGLEMLPLKPGEKHPPSADEAVLELVGSPAHLYGHADESHVQCKALTYQTLRQLLEVTGDKTTPMRVDSKDFAAGGERFWFDRQRNTGGFTGPGWMESRAVTAATMPAGEQVPQAPDDGPMRIDWSRSVNLEFAKSATTTDSASEQDSKQVAKASERLNLQSAAFAGDVVVSGDDFTVNAGALDLTFTDPEDGRQYAKTIHAAQGVRIRSVADQSSLACGTLDVTLAQSDAGRTIPVELVATGSVEASDESQTVWADSLHAWFAESHADVSAAPESRLSRSGIEIVRVLAENNVQARLNDGTRAFADRLEGDPALGKIALVGESNDVVIANQTMIIDKGKRLDLSREEQTARWPGPGRARSFKFAVIDATTGPVSRPVVNESANPQLVHAVWSESMVFDNTFNHGDGALELIGKVDAQSQPTNLEHNTMRGEVLRLEFARVEEESRQGADAGAKPQEVFDRGGRRLAKIWAKTGARLESRSWLFEDHSDEPRLYHLVGETVWYDNITLESGVESPGELLIQDKRVAAADDEPQADQVDSQTVVPFSERGTSLFKWKDSLRMTRQEEDRFLITMQGDVDAMHQDLTGQNSILTGRMIQALVERSETARDKSGALDMGGSMQVQHLRGEGGLYIRTPKRDVQCDGIEYDLVKRIAELSAPPGQFVTVLTRGNPNVQRAQRFSWDMNRDVITIVGGSGTANRK